MNQRFSDSIRQLTSTINQRTTIGESKHIQTIRTGIAKTKPGKWSQFWTNYTWQLKMLWRQPASKLCLALVAFSLWWSAASAVTHVFSLPSTDLLIHNTNFYFDKILVLAIVWIAGDLIWRDRMLRVNELVAAQPISNLITYLSKTLVLLSVVIVFWTLSIGVNVLYQMTHGYFRLEPGLYLTDSFVFKGPFYFWMSILAISVQTIVRHRLISIGIVLLVYVGEVLLDAMGWHHPMTHFGRVSHFWYSLMDGYGHFWQAHSWLLLYWTLASIVVWLVGWACYWRGTNPPARSYLISKRLTGFAGIITALALILFTFTGAHIYRQSTILAQWPPLNEDRIKADLEIVFGKAWRNRPQPRIVEIETEIDLYPSDRRYEVRGFYLLENQSKKPIDQVLIPASPGLTIDTLEFENGATKVEENRPLNVSIWELNQTLQPGERTKMSFSTSHGPPTGFAVHSATDNIPEVSQIEIIGNGTAILNLRIMPAVGYTDRVEHKPAWKRRKYGLPENWSPPEAISAKNQGHGTLHLGWVESMTTTIRTDADQIALHAGRLEKEWTDPDGRRAFRYRMDRKSRGWSTIASARYKKQIFERNGLPDVEVYFDWQHESNVEPFARAIHDAMEYFAARYGPPPFETYRLAESSLHFDGFSSRGGLGYCSEILGWKSDLDGDGSIHLKKTAALMMAFSWCGDQIIPANIAGAKVIHSGLPYWLTELYMNRTTDPEISRQMRLQSMMELFRSRGELTDEEGPFNTEFKDSTMIRRKGSLLMLHLANLVGIEKLEKIFAEFMEQHRLKAAPYPTADELVRHVKMSVDKSLHNQVDDIFEQVTIWRIAVKSATCVPVNQNAESQSTKKTKWRLTAVVDARKFYTKGWGEETEVDLKTDLQLAAFNSHRLAAKNSEIWSELRSLKSGENKIEIILDQKPTLFAVDPYLFLPDPNPQDNSTIVR